MTLEELSRLYRLKEKGAELHMQLEELWRKSTAITHSHWDGMPRTTSRGTSRTERYAVDIADVKSELM